MKKPIKPFSDQLQSWLDSDQPKTLGNFTNIASEKSFALLFVILMAVSALPLPTGGITHLFAIITMLLALELIAGRKTIWLPKKWLKRNLGKTLTTKTLPYLARKIRWLERFSRQRGAGLLQRQDVLQLAGLTVLLFTVGAFLAPPFSGLDTLPALGVVGIGLALIFEDIAAFIIAGLIGMAGILIEVTLGAAIVRLIQTIV